MAGMRSRLRQDETRLEEQIAWRKEQLEREIAALIARRTSMVAAMQNLKGIADEATPDSGSAHDAQGTTDVEETTVIPWAVKDTGGDSQ